MAGKIFDVAKPGTSKPSSTSKPVIIGHKAKLDPMVSSSSAEPVQSEVPSAASAPLLPKPDKSKSTAKARTNISVKITKSDNDEKLSVPKVRSTIKILPPDDDMPDEDDNPTKDFKPESMPDEEMDGKLISEIAKPVSESKPEPKVDSKPAKQPEPVEPPEPSEDIDGQESTNSIDEAIKEPEDPDAKKPINPEVKAAQAQREMIEKLIKDETYALPIKTVTERRVRRGAIIALLVVLALVALYVSVDAGIIKPGFDVPFHLIKH